MLQGRQHKQQKSMITLNPHGYFMRIVKLHITHKNCTKLRAKKNKLESNGGGHWGFAESRNGAILGAEMRKSIIVSAKCGQCIYSGPLADSGNNNFCLQICGNRGKNCGNVELHTPSDPLLITSDEDCDNFRSYGKQNSNWFC